MYTYVYVQKFEFHIDETGFGSFVSPELIQIFLTL